MEKLQPALAQVREGATTVMRRMQDFGSVCFLVSDGLLLHWRKLAMPHIDFSKMGMPRPMIFDQPVIEDAFYKSKWREAETWYSSTERVLAQTCAILGECRIPGLPEKNDGPAWSKHLNRHWEWLTSTLDYQTEHWGTEEARFNQAPELAFTKLWQFVESLLRWVEYVEDQIGTFLVQQALSREAANKAASNAKLRTPQEGRLGEIMDIVRLHPEYDQSQVAAAMGLHKSKLSREPFKSAYLKAKALFAASNAPAGAKDRDGRIEAVADEEE